jgi:hypothetical protein
VLYVVDSVTRQWVDQARKAGQTPGSGAPDGTFAAGVNRVTELLPVLLTDIINTAPDDQKVRHRNEGYVAAFPLCHYFTFNKQTKETAGYFAY